MKEGKTKSIGKNVIIILLTILLLGSLGFIGYDKFFKKDNSKESNVKTNEKKEENLDINSRLVQSLYNKVSTGENNESESSMYFNYIYKDDNFIEKDFYADKADEQQKMKILSRLINKEQGIYYNCENSNIPDTLSTNSSYKSVCSKVNGTNDADQKLIYSKEYISNLYKDLYGKDATIDTNAIIYMDFYKVGAYSYVESLDSYLLYHIEGGGTTGPGGSYANITKAVKNGNKLKIYEKVTNISYNYDETTGTGDDDESNKETTTSNYIYTFNLEDDGMYSFYSRVKES